MKRSYVYGKMVGNTESFIMASVSGYVRHHDNCPLQFENYGAAHDFIWEALRKRDVTFDWLVDRTLSVSDISTRFGRWRYRETAAYAVTNALNGLTYAIQKLGVKGLLT